MDEVLFVMQRVGEIMWGPVTVLLFLFCGLFFTCKLRLLQFTGAKQMLKTVFGKNEKTEHKEVSVFQSMCTALAASIGTGNITGVCAAISTGGPGAVLWMCLSAMLGEATAYAENYLGVVYREYDSGQTLHGGAMYTIKNGLGVLFSQKTASFFAMVYAFLSIASAFGMGNAVQVNAAAQALNGAFGVPMLLTGAFCAVCVAVLMYKGRTAVARLTSFIVPIGCVAFFGVCICVLIARYKAVPSALNAILCSAFGLRSVGAGFSADILRRSISVGVRRGIFSNEAGLGTVVAAHAAADGATAQEQGLRSMAEVFLDTVAMCTLTAVCVLCVPDAVSAAPSQMFATALHCLFGTFAEKIVAASLSLFAFSTLLGWSFFGRESAHFVFGRKGELPFGVLYCAVCLFGSTASFAVVWDFADIINASLGIMNLLCILALSKEVHFARKREN